MSDSSQVRQWASQQEPPLAKGDTRGRLSKAAVEAFNAAHPGDLYSPTKSPARPAKPVVTPPPTAETTEQALRPDGAFTDPPEAGEAVIGEVVPQYDDAADSTEDVREYAAERYEETP